MLSPGGAGLAIPAGTASGREDGQRTTMFDLAPDFVTNGSTQKERRQEVSLLPYFESGTPTWTRTKDQKIKSLLLYQLSYRGVVSCLAAGPEGCISIPGAQEDFDNFLVSWRLAKRGCKWGSGRPWWPLVRRACRWLDQAAWQSRCCYPDGRTAATCHRGRW